MKMMMMMMMMMMTVMMMMVMMTTTDDDDDDDVDDNDDDDAYYYITTWATRTFACYRTQHSDSVPAGFETTRRDIMPAFFLPSPLRVSGILSWAECTYSDGAQRVRSSWLSVRQCFTRGVFPQVDPVYTLPTSLSTKPACPACVPPTIAF